MKDHEREHELEYSALRRRYGLTIDKREPWPIRLREWWRQVGLSLAALAFLVLEWWIRNVWHVVILAILGFVFWVIFGDLILRWWFFGCPC